MCFNGTICFWNFGVSFFVALIFRNLMMRTLQGNTITAQITDERVAPVSLRNDTSDTWPLFTQLASGSLLLGVFGLYLYLYLYFFGNERW